jgi:CoA-transferase family III
MEIIRIGDSDPEPLPTRDRPLSGIRVLDLTRVLAGPTCARTLAEHGADVLRRYGLCGGVARTAPDDQAHRPCRISLRPRHDASCRLCAELFSLSLRARSTLRDFHARRSNGYDISRRFFSLRRGGRIAA